MADSPLLLLIALHLRSMLPMPLAFWRVRRLERELKGLPGVLKVHRWLSRRSLLLTVWCGSEEVADACLAAPGLAELRRRAGAGRGTRLWAERYALLPGALHLGATGAPTSAHPQRHPDGPEGREALGGGDKA